MLCDDVEGDNSLTLEAIILSSVMYSFLVNVLSKQNRALRHGMRKPRGLKWDDNPLIYSTLMSNWMCSLEQRYLSQFL